MNRKLALVLTIAIFAAIAFCFLRPTEFVTCGEFVTYGEFGNIKPVYFEGDLDIPFTLSGETDLLTVTKLEYDGQGAATIYLNPAKGRNFSMGAADVNMRVHPWYDGTPFDLATVERYENDEWVHYSDIDDFSFAMPAIDFTRGPVVLRSDLDLPISVPFIEPGKYRVTFNFREAFGDIGGGFSCEDTVHHITMEYEIRDASSSRYDIVCLVVLEPEWRGFTRLRFMLRANEGETPFRRYDKVDIEKSVGGKWEMQDLLANNAILNYYQRWDLHLSNYHFSDYYADLTRALEPNSDYRITMYFTEKDGGKDYMPLQIHIRTLDR